jgi:hypothetical protein
VLGILPVNPADNVLHILLTVTALAAGLVSDRDRRGADRDRIQSRSGPGARRFDREPTADPTPTRR